MDTTKVERVYDGYARIYDRIFGRVFFQTSRGSAVRGLGLKPGERVLEVGVGTGLTLPLFPRHCRVVGVDLADAMLEKARERVRRLGLGHVELRLMDAGAMDFEDDAFDVVVAAYVVTAVPDYGALLREMIRVCRPGGRIVLLNHFLSDHRVVGAIERAISPLCEHIGFRTDLSVEQVLDGHAVLLSRHERIRPFGLWRLVECVNDKSNGKDPASTH